MDRNAVVAAERTYPRLPPAVAASCRLAGAIEEPCDLPVGHQPRQFADEGECILGYRPAVLAGSVLFHFQRGVIAALPMQDHLDVPSFDANDDFVQSRTHNPFPRRRGGSWMRPGTCEVGAKLHQLLPLRFA